MRKVLLCAMLFALYPLPLFAQAPDTLWTKTYGGPGNDVGHSIKQTPDGGYIIAGYTETFGAGGRDVWLIKTDSIGDTVWTKTYGGTVNDWAEDVRFTSEGGYIIAANTNSFGLGQQIWLIKTDSAGDTTWTKIHGDYGNETCNAVQQTSDGGYIIAGNTPFVFNTTAPLLLKTNATGDTVWNTVLEWYGYGGSHIQSVIETYDSGFVVAGRYGTPWLGKFNANGDTLWNKHYTNGAGFLSSVEQMSDSGFIACGMYHWQDYCRLCIIRTDMDGDTLWTRLYDDSLFERSGNSGYWTNDNGYIITGGCGRLFWWESDLLFFKTDNNGDSLWTAAYGDSGYFDIGHEVIQTNDGGYAIIGQTELPGPEASEVWLLKFEPDIGVKENRSSVVNYKGISATIFTGPLLLPESKTCRVFDITGRVVAPDKLKPGIYFIEIDGRITQKVVKIR